MSTIDPILAALTGPGSPFEIGERDGVKEFVRAAPDLNLMIESARRHGDKTFVVEEGDDGVERRVTFTELFAWRDALAERLDVKPGDRVALCMRNRVEWMVAFLAVVKLGGIAALLNSRGSPDELVGMIDEVTPVLVLTDSERAALVREGGYQGALIDLTEPDLTEKANRVPAHETADPKLGPDSPCAILFTSGTTGRVKGAVLSHRNLITGLMGPQLTGFMVLHNMAKALGRPVEELIAASPQQGVLLVYPLFHISGLGSAFLSPLLSGSKVVIMRRWDAGAAVELIEREKLTQFSAVPTMLWDMLHRARLGEHDLTSLRNIASGGQALPVNLLEEIRTACPWAVMGTGYGMTEAAGGVAQSIGEDFLRKPTSAGRIIPVAEARIAEPDGTLCPAGQAGEIQVRGPMIMQGYWNQPEATQAAFTTDGWLKTGDVGLIDQEGYVFIIDRLKDMVISGGENIYCAEVERILGAMPGVVECAAFGVPDERLGELLVAVVVGDPGDEQAVMAWVGEHLARYKAPGRVAFSKTPLARNDVGKINKIRLRAEWSNLSGAA